MRPWGKAPASQLMSVPKRPGSPAYDGSQLLPLKVSSWGVFFQGALCLEKGSASCESPLLWLEAHFFLPQWRATSKTGLWGQVTPACSSAAVGHAQQIWPTARKRFREVPPLILLPHQPPPAPSPTGISTQFRALPCLSDAGFLFNKPASSEGPV